MRQLIFNKSLACKYLFKKSKFNLASSPNKQQTDKIINPVIYNQYKKLAKLLYDFQINNSKYYAPLKHTLPRSSLLYPIMYTRSLLIMKYLIDNEKKHEEIEPSKILRILKTKIKYKIQKQDKSDKKLEQNDIDENLNRNLSPTLCLILMQLLHALKFEGDQNFVIEYVCRYYEINIHRFSQIQQKIFWQHYMRLMKEKVHEKGTIKFRKLQRLQYKTREFSKLNETIKKQIQNKYLKTHKFITSTRYIPNNDIFEIQLKVPINGSIKKEYKINLRFLPLINSNSFEDTKAAQRNIMSQIIELNKALKKGWTLLFHNNIRNINNFENQELINNVTNGKIIPQLLLEYYKQDTYFNAICYNNKVESQNSKEQARKKYLYTLKQQDLYSLKDITQNSSQESRTVKYSPKNIQQILSILMGIAETYKQNGKVYLFNFNQSKKYSKSQTKPTDIITQYLNQYELRQYYGYSKLCSFHQQLLKQYMYLQSLQKNKKQKQKKQIYKFALGVEEQDLEKYPQAKINKSGAHLLKQYTLKCSKDINQLKLSNYNYHKMNQSKQTLCTFASDAHWIFQRLVPDTKILYDQIIEIIKNSTDQNLEKQFKFMIVMQQDNSHQIVRNFVKGKFLGAPVLTNQNQSKQEAQFKSKMANQLGKIIN